MPSIDTHVLSLEILHNGLRFVFIKESISKHLKPSYSILDHGEIIFSQTVFKDESILNSELLVNEVSQVLQRVIITPDHIVTVCEQGRGRKKVKRFSVNDIIQGRLAEQLEIGASVFSKDLFKLHYQSPNRYDLKERTHVPLFYTLLNQKLIKQINQIAALNKRNLFMLDWSNLAILRLLLFHKQIREKTIVALQAVAILENDSLHLFIVKGRTICFTQSCIIKEDTDKETVEAVIEKVHLFLNAFDDNVIDELPVESCLFFSNVFPFNEFSLLLKKRFQGLNIDSVSAQILSPFKLNTNDANTLLPYCAALGAALVFFEPDFSVLPVDKRPQFLFNKHLNKQIKKIVAIVGSTLLLMYFILLGQFFMTQRKIEKIEVGTQSAPTISIEGERTSKIDHYRKQFVDINDESTSIVKNWNALLFNIPDDFVVDAVTMVSSLEVRLKGRVFLKDSLNDYLDMMKERFPIQRVESLSTLSYDNVPLYTFSLYLSKDKDPL